MIKKLSLIICLLAVTTLSAVSQMLTPVTWEQSIIEDSPTTGRLVFKASVEKGWHLYGMDLPADGPVSTQFKFTRVSGVELVGDVTPSEPATKRIDTVFHLELGWWDSDVTFTQNFKRASASTPIAIEGEITFQACNDQTCIMPTHIPIELSVGAPVAAAADTTAESQAETAVTSVQDSNTSAESSQWWQPVTFASDEQQEQQSEWWYIFIWGFVGGILALLTPCVWPMIPLTVSFFLKKNGSRSKSVRDAVIYGVAIIVIYLILGLVITMIFGASKLNELSTNSVFNLFFFLLLVVFAISFFGAFDIKLPARWSNSIDGKAEQTTGLISIFFMAFTLALVSFSCTGPIIGTLLVEAASMGDITGPAIGMGAFALALAIPFALFAIFPSMLKEMPRSGGWLNSVKVVLGFIELALSLKFLSVADLAYGWGILDRETFIVLWVMIFLLLTMYLLGKLRFSHDAPLEHVSISRFFLALISGAFALYLIPGLWGAPLKGVSAFVPPLYTQDFNLYHTDFHSFDDYDEGMAYAERTGKPVLVDFSGYGCVNCRKMEGAVFDTDEVSGIIRENFVMITLMVDDKRDLDHPMTVEENGRKVKLRTVGDKWSYLQRSKFHANSQPYYVMLDNSGQPLGQPYYYDENVAKFVQWLSAGLDNYKL